MLKTYKHKHFSSIFELRIMAKSHIFGKKAEAAVVNLLEANHFTILEQNYTKFCGEIDIIAQKDDVIIFVEVKARNNPRASMFEIVTPSKQQKIIQTARAYIAATNKHQMTHRFDVALIVGNECDDTKITYIPNAFYQKGGL